MRSLTTLDTVMGSGFGGASEGGLRSVLLELQSYSVSLVAGFGAGVSGALTDASGNSASAGGGDTLAFCHALATNAIAVDLTGSASISNDRVLVADTATTGKMLQIGWYNQDGA